ncbi:MAG: haloacid dehalogenase, partial [Bacteroidaceae bacterium]|nr:haloacid dehalogenase [Bacteroidaceae bacterium]
MEQRQHQGLSAEEVRKSREQHGANILTPQEKEPLWRQYLEKCEDPLIIVLIIAGVLSVGIAVYEFCSLDHGAEVFFEPLGIFIAILLATGLAFYFELKANKAFNLLNQVNDDEP